MSRGLCYGASSCHHRDVVFHPPQNILAGLPDAPLAAERFDDILRGPHARIERIISTGQSAAPGEWQCQAWDEWVLLIEGAARICLGDTEIALERGDHLLIPAGMRHRVGFTAPDRPKVWLAVHIGEPG